ncbi:MAG: hypothetical protein H6744_07695 [Deltaproteobacteria bacterium]|nr:hypothetical protein [Deltaproteobacteria bacterium]
MTKASVGVMRAAALAALSLALLCACGGVKTATRADGAAAPVQPFLVQVVDALPDEPLSIQSLSVLEVNVQDPFSEELDEANVERMRQAAAGQGAELLVLERVETPTRHAWYGFGVRREPGGVSPRAVDTCVHGAAAHALAAARSDAERCLRTLREERPAASGLVHALFQVDAFGAVYRVAATPESSRDSAARQCVLEAVAARDFGDHEDFLCRLDLEVRF